MSLKYMALIRGPLGAYTAAITLGLAIESCIFIFPGGLGAFLLAGDYVLFREKVWRRYYKEIQGRIPSFQTTEEKEKFIEKMNAAVADILKGYAENFQWIGKNLTWIGGMASVSLLCTFFPAVAAFIKKITSFDPSGLSVWIAFLIAENCFIYGLACLYRAGALKRALILTDVPLDLWGSLESKQKS